MDYEILPPVDDWVFKLLFGDERNKPLLAALLASFLDLPAEEFDLVYLDPHLQPEDREGKLGILDVKVRLKSGKIINIEIQVNPFLDIGRRISFYKSKLIVGQIRKGEDYEVIQRVICICIADYVLFRNAGEYLNRFRFYNPKNGLCFEEIPEEIYTLELPKLPERSDGTGLWDWMCFLRARRREEFEMAAEKQPEIRRAVDSLYELSADGARRAEYDMRQKARLDWNSAINGGWRQGREEGRTEERLEIAHKLKALGMSTVLIAQSTGLTEAQIEALP